MKPYNINKPGTAPYYKDAVDNVVAVGSDYDGYDENDAYQMRKLLKEMKEIIDTALNLKPLYMQED